MRSGYEPLGLNPYSIGIRIERRKIVLKKGQVIRLNPYSIGIRIELI